MMKTALSIVQDFCYRSNLPAPTALYNETDPNTLQLLHCMYEACRRLRAARCFPQQKRRYTFETVDDTAQYDLPTDYYSPLLNTFWNEEESSQMAPAQTDPQFTSLLYSGKSSTTNYAYRIFGPAIATLCPGQLWLNPTPSEAQTISFEYVTRNLFLPATFTLADYTAYETVGADTYLCLFDHDLVSIGLEAEFIKRNRGDWEPYEQEFQSRIDAAVGRVMPPIIGSFDNPSSGPSYNVKDGSWSL